LARTHAHSSALGQLPHHMFVMDLSSGEEEILTTYVVLEEDIGD
jgi:hypothetical protein